MKRLLFILIAVILAGGLMVSGCATEEATPTPTATSTPKPSATATPTPTQTPTPPPEGTTVYVSVSVDGELLVAAQPVIITDLTLEAVILAAHMAYYSGGESGYAAGIDPTWNMYLVTKCWGVEATPFNVINDTLIAASVPEFVNTTPVAANDNVIIWTASTEGAAPPVSLAATVSGDSATVTATAWTFNPATFQSTPGPLADANVTDPTTGESLGTTDADGSITVTVPESGIVAVEGLAAIRVTIPAEGEDEGEGEGEGGGEGVLSISWNEAGSHIGETVKVTGPIVDYYQDPSSSTTAIGMGVTVMDTSTVAVLLDDADKSKFPEDLYVGKTISITGTLSTNIYGGPAINLTDPSQVEIVE